MLTIRFSRIGKKKKPAFRLIISEKSKDPYGRALEILGTYDPFTKELINPKKERINYWLGKGAQMSPTVNNLLIEKSIIKGNKVTASKPGKKKAKDGEEKEEKESAAKEEKEKEPKKEEKPTEEKKADTAEAKEEKKDEKKK